LQGVLKLSKRFRSSVAEVTKASSWSEEAIAAWVDKNTWFLKMKSMNLAAKVPMFEKQEFTAMILNKDNQLSQDWLDYHFANWGVEFLDQVKMVCPKTFGLAGSLINLEKSYNSASAVLAVNYVNFKSYSVHSGISSGSNDASPSPTISANNFLDRLIQVSGKGSWFRDPSPNFTGNSDVMSVYYSQLPGESPSMACKVWIFSSLQAGQEALTSGFFGDLGSWGTVLQVDSETGRGIVLIALNSHQVCANQAAEALGFTL
jgi:hypothetical protein